MIRQGFVSNSSSSSFILSYNKNNVIKGASNIVNFLKEDPDYEIIFDGGDYGEGSAVLELTDDYKTLIKRYSNEFINNPDGCNFKIYYGEPLFNANYVDEDSISLKYLNEDIILKKIKKETNKNIWDISANEFNEAVEKILEEEKVKSDNREALLVWIDYYLRNDSNLDSNDFYQLFINPNGIEDYNNSEENDTLFAIVYDRKITNKEAIYDYLSTKSPYVDVALCREYKNTFHNLELFYLDEDAIEYLLSHKKEFLEAPYEATLYLNYKMYSSTFSIEKFDVGKQISLMSGKFEVISNSDEFLEVFFERVEDFD